MQTEAAIDNDFIMHLAEIDNWSQDELEEKISIFFSELGVIPIMHELVYKHELKGGAETRNKEIALGFFKHNIVALKIINDFLDSEQKKKYYLEFGKCRIMT